MNDILSQDRVWQAISDALAGRQQRHSQTGFTNICCTLCPSRGETPDRKFRCGIKRDGAVIGISCFNCQFRTRFTLGAHLNANMRSFLASIGVSEREIAYVSLWAEMVRRRIGDDPVAQQQLETMVMPEFPAVTLPPGARSLQEWADLACEDADYLATVEYLLSRGDVAATATTYYWTPRLRRRLVIPCYQDRRLVGWTARAIDAEARTRYHKEVPSNYLFNTQVLTSPAKYLLVVEGVIDALVINGLSPMGATLNQRQIGWIDQCGKQPVVIADRDRAGRALVTIAINQGWPVASPHFGRHQWWEADIKDVADAVQRYGKLYAVQSILATQEFDPGKIQQRASYHLR